MRFIVVLALSALLSACGADGEPVTPTMSSTIGLSSGGAYGQVNVHNGPVTISVGRSNCYNCW